MNKTLKIINAELKWQDLTPLNAQFNDPYFSLADGLRESEYVFLQHNQLPARWTNRSNFVIAETGFGTGLNFLVTANEWQKKQKNNSHLTYYSVEKFPLSRIDFAKSLSVWPQFSDSTRELLGQYPGNIPGYHCLQFDDLHITLVLMIGDAKMMLDNILSKVDCWYLDGFSPAKNPEMWTLNIFQKIAKLSQKGSTFSTFTAAGEVRRNLSSVGFDVKKAPGFGKKREMIHGVFISPIKSPNQTNPWFDVQDQTRKDSQKVVIVGGGLAGLSCAWMLSQQKIPSTLIEAGDQLASGASGNAAGIVMPLISLDLNLTSQFYIAAYLYAIACLNRLKKINPTLQWHQSGVLALMPQSRWQQIKSLDLPSQLMQCLTQPQVSSHAGMALTSEGIFYPHGGYVNAQQLCSILANESGNYLTQKRHTQIKHLKRMDDGWQLIDNKNRIVAKADTVILANGFTVQELLPANDLKLSKRYGQLTNMPCQESFSGLKMPVCADGYIIPQQNAGSILGASYRLNAQDGKILAQDHVANIQSVNQCFERQIPMETEHLTGRVSYRTTSLDHLPVVGPIPDEVVYHKDYEDIQHGRKSKNYPSGRYLPSLYVSTGHGSRGLVSCFASADYLTSLISRKPLTFSRSTVELLHPARFLIRSMKKSR